MSDLFGLSQSQPQRIEPYFPPSHGVPRDNDRKAISGIMFVVRDGLRWRDAPKDHGPHKNSRFVRWSCFGVFDHIFASLAADKCAGHPDDRYDPFQGAQDCREPAQQGVMPRRIGRTKGGLNSKLHVVVYLRDDLDELFTCFRYKSPMERNRVRTTNAIERRFLEARRRTRPMGTFQDTTSTERSLFAVSANENESQGVSSLFLLTQNNRHYPTASDQDPRGPQCRRIRVRTAAAHVSSLACPPAKN